VIPRRAHEDERAQRYLLRLCAGIAGAALLWLPSSAAFADDGTPNASELFAHARAQWRARVVPRYIRYTTTMRTRVNRKIVLERDEVILRTRDRQALVRVFRSDRSARNGEVKITSPRLVPDSTFGLAAHAAEDPSPFAAASAAPAPPVIGHVVATSRPMYDVSLVGSELVDGHPCWHLALRPAAGMSGPLRDVWIDREGGDIRKLGGVTDVRRGPFRREVPFEATFADYGGAWLIARAQAAGGVHIAFLRYTAEGQLDFSNYAFPADVPDYCFDRALHDAHGEDAACTTP
jgi:hypothetical protein